MGFDALARIVEVASGQSFDHFLQEHIFVPLGMKDTSFNVPTASVSRRATTYDRRDGRLQVRIIPCCRVAGSGGLFSTAEDYWVLAQLLANGGEFGARRLLGPRTVDLMTLPHAPDTLPGRYGPGHAFGLSMRVVTDKVKAMSAISDGSFGWNGATGTYFWVDPKEKIVAILMVQTPIPELQRDFEQAVMQAVIE